MKRDDIEVLFLRKDGDEAPPAFLAADPSLFIATIPCFFGAIDSYLSGPFGLALLALFPYALANLPFPQRFRGLGNTLSFWVWLGTLILAPSAKPQLDLSVLQRLSRCKGGEVHEYVTLQRCVTE